MFYVGQRIKIIGDIFDFTDSLDGRIGTILTVRTLDCVVKVDNDECPCWMIWNYNIIPLD